MAMMQRRAGGAGAGSGAPGGMPGGMPGASQGGGGPAASPIPQQQEKAGLKAHAATNLAIAQNMMEQAITAYHPGDKEYKAILKCLNLLEPLASKSDSSDLVPAEVMRMAQGTTQTGGGNEMQQKIMQMMKAQGQPGAQQPAPQQPGM